MRTHKTARLCLLSTGIVLLGCGGIIDTIKSAIGIGDAPQSAQPAPRAPATASLRSDQLTDGSIVLMGTPGRTVTIYKDATVDPDGDDLRPRFISPIKTAPTGTRGRLLMSMDIADYTYAMEIELADGTRGVVDVGDLGLIHRVRGVRSDDTLNIRTGRSHKRPKLTELGPTEVVFAEAEGATSAAGCEMMRGKEKWWKVRTTSGIEGYVNCTYLGNY
jgi:hypothetical protein